MLCLLDSIVFFLVVWILGATEMLAKTNAVLPASGGPFVSAPAQHVAPLIFVARDEKRPSMPRWKELWGKLFVKRTQRSRKAKPTERDSPRLKKVRVIAIGNGDYVASAANFISESPSNVSPLKELHSFLSNPPPNCQLEKSNSMRKWTVRLRGVQGTVYSGEMYRLRLEFPANYPSLPPKAYFLKPVPRHTHVYSNGDICLNVLGADWSPSMTAESLVVSILSMLSSAKEKGIPQDNSLHSAESPGKQQDNWIYHDDKC